MTTKSTSILMSEEARRRCVRAALDAIDGDSVVGEVGLLREVPSFDVLWGSAQYIGGRLLAEVCGFDYRRVRALVRVDCVLPLETFPVCQQVWGMVYCVSVHVDGTIVAVVSIDTVPLRRLFR